MKVKLEIQAVTAEYAAGVANCDAEDFDRGNGVYRVLNGSRGLIEEIEYLGEVDEIDVQSIEELIEEADEDEKEEAKAYFEEFYFIEKYDDHYLFGYTEEDCDVFVRIG